MALDVLDVDFSSVCDSTGAVVIPIKLSRAFYAVANVVGQVVGANSAWSVLVNQRLWKPGRGSVADMGPILLQPTDALSITITGATPAATVSGKVAGLTASTLQEALQHYSPAPNLISLETTTQRQKLFPDGVVIPATPNAPSFTVGATSTATPRFTLPTGTAAVRLLVNASGLLFSYSLFVGGHQSNEQYFGDPAAPGAPLAVPTVTLPFTIPIERDCDSQLDFSLVNPGANQLNVFVSALFAPEAPGQAGASQSVFIPTPAPWQAATSVAKIAAVSIAPSSTLLLVTALAGKVVYLHGYSFSQDAANAAAQWQLQDTGGSAIGTFLDAAVRHVFASGTFAGAPVTAPGLGVQMLNGGAAASFFSGYLSYSQQ